jgi:NADPH-dependent ferric siderophore reductase
MSQPQPAQRVRHETRMRMLTVLRTKSVTPKMLRVTLGGADLQGFVSAAADDHVKLFFPERAGGAPILPAGPPGTPQAAEAPRPIARDYTPRRYDASAHELDIEFSLHGDGPAAQWAAQARAGHKLAVGGPRGSFVVSNDFDWYLFIGDDTALPAIGRRLSELPAGVRGLVIAEVDDRSEEQLFQTSADLQVTWLHRGGSPAGEFTRLQSAVSALKLPKGTGYTWIASESNVARGLRQFLVAERQFDKQWLKAAGYWKHGSSATHEKHED